MIGATERNRCSLAALWPSSWTRLSVLLGRPFFSVVPLERDSAPTAVRLVWLESNKNYGLLTVVLYIHFFAIIIKRFVPLWRTYGLGIRTYDTYVSVTFNLYSLWLSRDSLCEAWFFFPHRSQAANCGKLIMTKIIK